MSTEEQKAAANAERAAIKVETIKAETDTKESEKVVEAELEAKESEEAETTEEKEEQVEAAEKTEEELEAEKAEAKSAAEKARVQKRIDKEVAKRKVLEKELEDLKKIIAAKTSEDGDKITKEEAEKLAEEKAEAKVQEREFVNACNRLADAAKKLDKDFDKKINQLSEDVAPLPGYMIGILDDLDNGGAVLKYFTENPDEYEDIIALSVVKMGVKLAKLSDKLETESRPKPKPASKVPQPISPVGGKGGTSNAILTEADTKNMSEFVKKRAAMVEQRRKSGHYNAR